MKDILQNTKRNIQRRRILYGTIEKMVLTVREKYDMIATVRSDMLV